MDRRESTHLSAEEIYAYLLGKPATSLRNAVEEHCLLCPKCLEDMCVLTARIDKMQMVRELESASISGVPGDHVPGPERLPALTGRVWQGWAGRAMAASLVLLILPDTIRLVRLDRLLESPLTTASLDLPFTREYPSSLTLLAMTKVELESPSPIKETVSWAKPQKQFHLPQLLTRRPELVQVALIDPPDLKFTDEVIDPPPAEIEVTPTVAAPAKQHILKRLLSAVAAPFRSPRT